MSFVPNAHFEEITADALWGEARGKRKHNETGMIWQQNGPTTKEGAVKAAVWTLWAASRLYLYAPSLLSAKILCVSLIWVKVIKIKEMKRRKKRRRNSRKFLGDGLRFVVLECSVRAAVYAVFVMICRVLTWICYLTHNFYYFHWNRVLWKRDKTMIYLRRGCYTMDLKWPEIKEYEEYKSATCYK